MAIDRLTSRDAVVATMSIEQLLGDSPVDDYNATHPLRPFAVAGAMSVALFSLGSIILFLTLRTPSLAARTDPVATYTLCVVLFWCGSIVAMLARPPSPVQAVLVWGRITNILIWSLHGAVAWLIWVVLPKVSLIEQYYTTAFMVAYVPTQIISSPESTFANRAGIFIVIGSMVILLLTLRVRAATMLACYLAFFGALMFVLSNKILRTVQATVSQRLASDMAARELNKLLAIVSSERDAKTRFIAAASHDLGQPLQAAALFFDQSLRARDPDARALAIDGVHRAFASAEQLLAHMLNHLRLEADEVSPHLSSIRLPGLLERIATQYSAAAAQANIRISIMSADLALLLDPVLIERALGNLVQNAIDHSRGRRALIAARHHNDDAIRFWVIDDGAGVSRGDAKLIFDEYYQGALPAGERPRGFGLGLSSVRRLTNLMGGSAGVDLRWQGGAAFYLEFPRLEGAVGTGALQRTAK